MTSCELSLSTEQLAALGLEISLIEAGPGSGKTRTVVARFLEQSARGQSVALLSFTNAAIGVARARCAGAPNVLEAPNFVGTFDRFFHRYVVTPAGMRSGGTQPRYFASWDDLPDHLSVVRPVGGGVGIRLSMWSQLDDGTIQLDASKLNHQERQMWNALSDYPQRQLRAAGASRVRSLLGQGIYDTTSARRLALAELQSGAWARRLARRFGELIVDEFQDCDDVEHRLLGALAAAGMHVVAVADPDQAIYEFRQIGAAVYGRYRASVPAEAIAVLSTCYRSTPAICALATKLRCESTDVITSHQPLSEDFPLIQVVVGTGTRAGAAAARLVSRFGIPYESTRVLSHRRSEARSLAHTGSRSSAGNSTMGHVIKAVSDLTGSVDSRVRRSAMGRLESIFVELVDWPNGEQPDTRDAELLSLGATADQLRIVARRIVDSSRGWADARTAADSVKRVISEAAAQMGVNLIPTLGRRVAKPQPAVWAYWLARAATSSSMSGSHIKWTNVHAVKGEEFEAVVYALPTMASGGSHVIDDWQNGRATEARRVLYVGVTRARRLVILVTPPGRRGQLEQILDRDGISYELTVA